MRLVAYAAAAYAVCMGGAQAFASLPVAGLRQHVAATSSLRMQYENPSDVMARVNAMMSGSPVPAAPAFSAPVRAAPSYKAPAVVAENASTVMQRVNSMMGGAAAPPAPSPTWRWAGQDPAAGYNPRRRSSRASSPAYSAASSAPVAAEDPAAVMARVMAMMK